MSKKFHGNTIKEVDSIFRILSSTNAPDAPVLQRLFILLKKYPQAFSHQVGRIESSLLSVVNARKVSCDLQKSVHTHYSHHNTDQNKSIRIAASCFSLLPALASPPYRSDRFLDFQLKVLYALSESYSTVLNLLKFSHINLSSLNTHLASKCKHFASLSSFNRDEMPSPEYIQLFFARIDFFTAVLRLLFESSTTVDSSFHLPMLVALFSAILSVELTAHGQTSDALLLRSSRLLHCLAGVCQTVGVKLLPASVSMLTLMVYQLDWTTCWREDSKLVDGLVRHRLAAYRCLQTLTSGMTELSSNRLVSLLPRILDQILSDLLYCTDGDLDLAMTDTDILGVSLTSGVSGSMKSTSIGLMKRRILMAVLSIVAKVFESPEHFKHSEPLLAGLGRLQLCLVRVMRQLTSGFPGGPPFKRLHSFCTPTVHPSVLNALLKAGRVLCLLTNSPRLECIFMTFAHELKTHSDPQVRSTAYEQEMLLVTHDSPSWKLIVPGESKPEEETVSRTELVTPIPKLVSSPTKVPNVCESLKEPILTETIPKRRRVEPPEVVSSSVVEEPVPPDQNSASLKVCLSAFDPTFV